MSDSTDSSARTRIWLGGPHVWYLIPILGVILAEFLWLWGALYSPDSFAYLLLGKSIWSGAGYQSIAVRDFYLPEGLLASRSFPPLWPVLVGMWEPLLGVHAGAAWNILISVLLIGVLNRLGEQLVEGGGVVIAGLVLHPGYVQEAVSGRSVPLTLLLVACALLLLFSGDTKSQPGWRTAFSGACLGAAALVRFDQAPLMGLIPLLQLRAWKVARSGAEQAHDSGETVGDNSAQVGTTVDRRNRAGHFSWGKLAIQRWRWVVLAYAGAAVVFMPWALRNLWVFGTPMASDSALSALALVDDITQLTWWESSRPPLLYDDPGQWVRMRIGFAIRNLVQLCVRPGVAVYVAAMLAGGVLGMRTLNAGRRRLLGILLLLGCVPLLFQTLTPYQGIRYTVIACLFWCLAALLGFRGACDAMQSSGVWRRGIQVWLTLMMSISVLSVLGSGDFVDRNSVAEARALRSELQELLPESRPFHGGLRLASNDAEAIAYVLGWDAIYLPRGISPEDEAFRGWMKRWHPRYLVVPAEWRGSTTLEASLGMLVNGKYRLLDGCRLSRESCQDG